MHITSEAAKITKATIEAAWRRRAQNQRLIVRDKECRSLALVVNATSMSWICAYRPRGTDPATKRRWPNKAVTIGNPASHSIEDARHEANRIKGQAAAGGDPASERKAAIAEAQRKRSTTMDRLFIDYSKVLPRRQKMRGSGKPSPSYIAEELAQVRMALVDMDATKTPAADLTVKDVLELLATAEGVTTARKRFGPLSRFLDWCVDAGHIRTNPCTGISRQARPKAPQERTHYLSPDELARLWRASERLREPIWRDLVRFLIVVPARRNEAAKMEWQHVDLDAAEWRQPSHLTKNRHPHRLHLPALALDLLRVRRKATGGKGLVFPAPRSGRPVDTFTDIKSALSKATVPKEGEPEAHCALRGWTWHDFRRSFATALGEAGISETVADAVLNHRQSATRGGVLGTYQRATRWPEQVNALKLWGRMLSGAIEGHGHETKVVALTARAG
jgi:integrase